MGRKPKNETSLRRIMTAKGLTCQKLADMTDIPKTTIENVAVGLQKFSPDRFVVVCRALDCVESDLADVKGNRAGRPSKPKPPAWSMPKGQPKPTEAPKPGSNPIKDSEKLWLYVHQLQRRVAQLEDQVKAAGL